MSADASAPTPSAGPGAGPGARPSAPAARWAALLLLFVLPLALRTIPLTHGGERGYVPDHHTVRQALGIAKDRDPVPPVGRYSTYPNLVPYLLVPCYAAQYLAGKSAGAWQDARGYGDHLLEHPQHAAWIARALVALLGALTTWVVWRAARAAGLRTGAWVAGWLSATGLLHVQLSTHERPWVPLVFFVALSAWAAIVYATTGRARHLAACGACAGLAFACHQSGLGALALPFFAWLLQRGAWTGRALRDRLTGGVLALLAFLAAGILLGHPYLLVHGRTPVEAVVGGAEADLSLGGMSVELGLRWASVAHMARAVFGYDPALVLLGLAGLALVWREPRLRAVGAFTVLWTLAFLGYQSDHVRYLLPAVVLLALPAGLLAERRGASPLARLAFVPVLVVPLVQSVRLVALLAREDTRALAERALAELPAGARVAIDRYGPIVDPSRGALILLERVRATCGEPLRAREAHRKLALESGAATGGIDALRVEDVLDFDERAGTVRVRPCLVESLGQDPREAFARLGVTHVLLAERRPDSGPSSLLAQAARLDTQVCTWTVDPAVGGRAREAFLPTEMDFPLTALWSVERPGPRLELVALR